jgi:hypothetical protein
MASATARDSLYGPLQTSARPTRSMVSSMPPMSGVSEKRPWILAHSSRVSLPRRAAYCSNASWRMPTTTKRPFAEGHGQAGFAAAIGAGPGEGALPCGGHLAGHAEQAVGGRACSQALHFPAAPPRSVMHGPPSCAPSRRSPVASVSISRAARPCSSRNTKPAPSPSSRGCASWSRPSPGERWRGGARRPRGGGRSRRSALARRLPGRPRIPGGAEDAGAIRRRNEPLSFIRSRKRAPARTGAQQVERDRQ